MTTIEDFLGAISLHPVGQAKSGPGKMHGLAHIRRPQPEDLSVVDLSAVADLRSMIDLFETPRNSARSPLFVSYYTANTPYEALADRLKASLDRLGLAHRIEPISSLGSWVANTGLKSAFIERVWLESDRPICWVDADAELLRMPWFVHDNPFDIAVVRRHGWYDISSFVYLNKTEATGRLVRHWAELCRQNPHVWDQVLLTLAWYDVTRDHQMKSLFLPDGVFRFPRPVLRDLRDRLFYYPRKKKMRPFVDQKQASRTLKSFVDKAAKRENELGSNDLSAQFMAALSAHDFTGAFTASSIFKG
ncbi:hypothetical protein GOZ78_22870 [Agrobacterium vitis]|uniref:Glycosyl transferase n=1 Tax=Agrobacterium vitis TaxID=373 RepID=A0ABD6GJ12_AGRVI|nr:hypothetical protein [Agrobacterium vitis]MUO80025.1 hypothetical protein [Agrobacterium vitis]MUO97249.1 hypothetical protein [Agrobacterium vitis]MUP07794.1 hypothetical protein [Agrobacterium vitis]MUZ82461.1 hypothetical protein [Agrobacterium vitis]MVA12848.1 hypothetical protein [Agrobacterium vitis]